MKMNKDDFNLLSLQDQLIILKTEGEELTQISSLENHITLFSYNTFLVEEYRSKESNTLIKIETFTENNEEERLKIYGPYIDFMHEVLEFQNKGESKAMAVCMKCDYEWFPAGNEEINEIKCPICGSGSWVPMLQKICSDCTSVYYSGSGGQKKSCPKCTK